MAYRITHLAVEGFKSISEKRSVDVAPLTILAGANSSGKSSVIQPLLLLKQTLDATYDPGPLNVAGDNVKFTSASEFLSRGNEAQKLDIEIGVGGNAALGLTFRKTSPTSALDVVEQRWADDDRTTSLSSESPGILRDRCFLRPEGLEASVRTGGPPISSLQRLIQEVIHVPGLRGTRERRYLRANTGPMFPGTFDHYHASLILSWQKGQGTTDSQLNLDLQAVGIAKSVFAHPVGDAFIDLRVGIVEHRDDNIADVGFGGSQILPVLVALRAAHKGRLVYLEEPEIHLHPRAQTNLAGVLADAANRGVNVVVETHSTLLLTAIQTLVAKGNLRPSLVKLHWFKRDLETGQTQVSSTGLDAKGAFRQDWPEDFDEVILDTDRQYLDAVAERSTG